MYKKLVTLFFFLISITTNVVFAASANQEALLKAQDKEIQELQDRLDKLEKTIQVLQKQLPQTRDMVGSQGVKQQQEISATEDQQSSESQIKNEYDEALALLKNGKFAEAEQKFGAFIQQHPKHKLNENALFWYAESYYRRDDFNQAAISYLKSYKEYPKGAKASDSLLKLAFSLGSLSKLKEACNILDKLDTEFPKRSEGSMKRSAEARLKFMCKKNKN